MTEIRAHPGRRGGILPEQGWTYDGTTFAAPPPVVPPKQLARDVLVAPQFLIHLGQAGSARPSVADDGE